MTLTEGEIHIRYRWPWGEAEKQFFETLKDEGVLTGARCRKCGRVMVPPRSFCEECFVRDIEYVRVPSTGELSTFAESFISLDGKLLDESYAIGIIRLDGTDGGLVHRLNANGKELKIGMKVRAVVAEDRTGSIEDIRYFEPVD